MAPHPRSAPSQSRLTLAHFLGTFRFSRRALELVWGTSRLLTVLLLGATIAAGLLPGLLAWLGKLIVDAVVLAAETGAPADRRQALVYVGMEGGALVVLLGVRRLLLVCRSLLRAQLGERVNVLILEKALTLSLPQFEDSEFYDRLTRARREASSRPLSLVNRTFSLIQNLISLATYSALLLSFSPWAVALLMGAGVPAFIAEAKFSGQAFRLFRWRSPETRKRAYLEMLLAREDYAKEVQLYDLGDTLLGRYRAIFRTLYREDRDLTLRRNGWGWVLGLLSTAALYSAYVWTALAAIARAISLGDMTMYLLVFKQGQSAFADALEAVGGMYEDNLYLSNALRVPRAGDPRRAHVGDKKVGPKSRAMACALRASALRYPGQPETPALRRHRSLHLKPGEASSPWSASPTARARPPSSSC